MWEARPQPGGHEQPAPSLGARGHLQSLDSYSEEIRSRAGRFHIPPRFGSYATAARRLCMLLSITAPQDAGE